MKLLNIHRTAFIVVILVIFSMYISSCTKVKEFPNNCDPIPGLALSGFAEGVVGDYLTVYKDDGTILAISEVLYYGYEVEYNMLDNSGYLIDPYDPNPTCQPGLNRMQVLLPCSSDDSKNLVITRFVNGKYSKTLSDKNFFSVNNADLSSSLDKSASRIGFFNGIGYWVSADDYDFDVYTNLTKEDRNAYLDITGDLSSTLPLDVNLYCKYEGEDYIANNGKIRIVKTENRGFVMEWENIELSPMDNPSLPSFISSVSISLP